MKKIRLFSIVLFALLAFSCKKDNSNNNTITENPLDPNEVTSNFSIFGAELKLGNPSLPSSNTTAPKLFNPIATNQAVIANVQFGLPILTTNIDDIAGVYVKVDGANNYFDVPASSINLRKTNNSIGLQILSDSSGFLNVNPGTIQPGTFCITYYIYNAQNEVSNAIKICYRVIGFGGADFLKGNWHVQSIEEIGYGADSYPKNNSINSELVDCNSNTYEFTGPYNFTEDFFWNFSTTTQRLYQDENGTGQDWNYVCANNGNGRVVNIKNYSDASGNWAYDVINKRVIVLTSKQYSYRKNTTENVILTQETLNYAGNDVRADIYNVVQISANQIRLDGIDYAGKVGIRFILKK
jgi:hypothetical protein